MVSFLAHFGPMMKGWLSGLIVTGELSAKDAFEIYTQKGAQIDYESKRKEIDSFYEDLRGD